MELSMIVLGVSRFNHSARVWHWMRVHHPLKTWTLYMEMKVGYKSGVQLVQKKGKWLLDNQTVFATNGGQISLSNSDVPPNSNLFSTIF